MGSQRIEQDRPHKVEDEEVSLVKVEGLGHYGGDQESWGIPAEMKSQPLGSERKLWSEGEFYSLAPWTCNGFEHVWDCQLFTMTAWCVFQALNTCHLHLIFLSK